MKYSESNKPLVCMQTQSTCYKGTSKMEIKGVLWHSTGANNPNLKRYVQPSDSKPSVDTYTKTKWLEVLGTNNNKNDWNHISMQAGLNCWIGKLASGSVATVQTMPWDYRPWGCGSGSKGSCNNGWIQFEICESDLNDKDYFNKVYSEACEITAYLCKLYNIDPKGTVSVNGVSVPTILCHADSYKLGLGSNHSDVNHWFPKYNKSMETVRNDVAALINATSVVKTYKVVTPVNRYTTSADAVNQKNAKADKLAAGTYYIYNKYPDGVNGVLNISTDVTGNSAGSWINPKENVVTESAQSSTANKLYRVRKSKDDAESQVGAFSVLQNAIDKCQEAGVGYHVFDWDYKIVYSYKAPVIEEKPTEVVQEPETQTPAVTPEPTPIKAVYELDYPEKTKIIDSCIVRSETDCVKAINSIIANNSDFDVDIAKAFFNLAPKYNIDPLMAISQSILETGWFKYKGSAVTAEQHNYCGLGVTSNGVTGGIFDSIEAGVTAQLQHLFAYGSKDPLPADEVILDPRFNLVTRGVATYWQQLAGRWACPGYDKTIYSTPQKAMEAGNTYGQKILAICKTIIDTNVSESDVEKYFPKPVEDVIAPDELVQDPTDATPEVNVSNDKATSIATLIFNCIKKLVQMFADLFSKGE